MSAVPGTFKNRPPVPRRVSPLVPGQVGSWAEQVTGQLLRNGALIAECYVMGECSIIVAREQHEGEYRWHLSVAHPSRYPTWDEIKTARYSLTELKDVPLMAQLLPLLSHGDAWVNAHENCFHLHEVRESHEAAASTQPEKRDDLATEGSESR